MENAVYLLLWLFTATEEYGEQHFFILWYKQLQRGLHKWKMQPESFRYEQMNISKRIFFLVLFCISLLHVQANDHHKKSWQDRDVACCILYFLLRDEKVFFCYFITLQFKANQILNSHIDFAVQSKSKLKFLLPMFLKRLDDLQKLVCSFVWTIIEIRLFFLILLLKCRLFLNHLGY